MVIHGLIRRQDYILNQSGDTIILSASPTFDLIGVNSIGNELTNASLAASEGQLFIRTHQNLWCVGEGQNRVPRE